MSHTNLKIKIEEDPKPREPRKKKDPAVPNWNDLKNIFPQVPQSVINVAEPPPVGEIHLVVLKYMATKQRWKDPKYQTEPDFLLVKKVLDWCNKYGK